MKLMTKKFVQDLKPKKSHVRVFLNGLAEFTGRTTANLMMNNFWTHTLNNPLHSLMMKEKMLKSQERTL